MLSNAPPLIARLLLYPLHVLRNNVSLLLIVAIFVLVDTVVDPNQFVRTQIKSFTLTPHWFFDKFPYSIRREILIAVGVAATITLIPLVLGQIWVSSNLRFHYLGEPKGILGSLRNITFGQFLWCFCNFLLATFAYITYEVACFVASSHLWRTTGINMIPVFIGLVAIPYPMWFAYVSLGDKYVLVDQRYYFRSWIKAWRGLLYLLMSRSVILAYSFYILRVLISVLFKVVVPVASIAYISERPLRIAIAIVSFTIAHAYVKSSSFELFLYLSRKDISVREYFHNYYRSTLPMHESPHTNGLRLWDQD